MGIILLKIGLILLAYLIGSIPSGLIIGKVFKGIDITKEGSKNIGASNTIRVLGLKYGILTLIMDVLKTILVLIFVRYLFPMWIADFNTTLTINNIKANYAIIYGVVSVFGHTFSVFLKFKGGKAVASSFAVVLVLTPIAAIIGLAIYFLIVLLFKYASIGSTCAAISVLISSLLQFLITNSFYENLIVYLSYIFLVLFILIKHLPNYKRLINGNEKKIYLFKKSKEKALD